MIDYAYTNVPGKIKDFLAKLRQVGIPTKVSTTWLESIGFASSNDRTLIGVLKQIGFVDSSGVPSPKWAPYRGANYKKILGDAVREGYSDLFALYPDANKRSTDEITSVFSTSSSGGQQVISKTVGTFRALVENAEFEEGVASPEPQLAAGPLHTPPIPKGAEKLARQNSGPSVHIDIQIHISPDATAEQIDQVFASMSKHLYGT